jgi:hypothetical protein
MKTVILFVVAAFSCVLAAQEPKPNPENEQATQRNECDAKMSESECDRKIQRDLASAIRENPKECSFEPDWRPTHVRYRTLHVNEVNGSTMVIAIDGKAYTLRNSACEGHDCSRWKPQVGYGQLARLIMRANFVAQPLRTNRLCSSQRRTRARSSPRGQPAVVRSELEAVGVAFVSLTDNVDLSTPAGRLMFQVIAPMSGFERELIRERVRAGLRNAKAKGRKLGRPAATSGCREDCPLAFTGKLPASHRRRDGVQQCWSCS